MSLGEHADTMARERAARDLDTSFVVTAGAGTGKTGLLVERMLHHIIERGTPLDRMAAITFTVKAASELRDRLADALERVVGLASGHAGAGSGGDETGRVLERLGKGDRAVMAERSRIAMETLDAAAIGTIHSFAAEILRRHHRTAGVDVGFEVDEGSRSRDLFDDLWPPYLEEVFGGEGEIEAWRRLLEDLPLETVEGLAKELVAFRVPLEALGPEASEVQLAHARAFAKDRSVQIAEIRRCVAGARGLNPRLPPILDRLDGIFGSVADKTTLPEQLGDLEDLPRSCTVGKKANVLDGEGMTTALTRLLSDARKLAGASVVIARDLAACLRPFVERFRREYLRRGFVSYDGLIVLARDLLRDHLEIRRAEAARFDHILLDEFQDTDPLQYEIFFFLAEASARGRASMEPERDAFRCRLEPGKLFIVGDAKQSIYHFRGADIRAFSRAVESIRREGGEVLTLSSNFRSVPEIVDPVNEIFAAQFPPSGDAKASPFDPEFASLAARREAAGSPRVEVWSVGTPPLAAGERRRLEADVIAAWIRDAVLRGDLRFRDVAILHRALTDVDVLLKSLRAQGVPYVVDGGKGFYRRYEVELLLALLRVVVSPADAVSLVACLRSPVCAVPDRELQEYAATPSEAQGPTWALDARPDPKRFPILSRAISMLADFARRRGGEPLDRIAHGLLDEVPLRLSMAASYDGGQRVANLEKAVRHVVDLARDARLGDADILERIEEEDSSQVDEGDSPLADETVDAVRILSIHKAKGLEWPVVVLPDLARSQSPPRGEGRVAVVSSPGEASAKGEEAICSLRAALPTALAISFTGVVTPAFLHHQEEEELHEKAEAKRLLYVAMTRARERLVLVVGPPKKGSKTWVDALAAWGYAIEDGRFPERDDFAGKAVLHGRFPDSSAARRTRPHEAPDERLILAARAFKEAQEGLRSRSGGRLRSPSEAGGQPAWEAAGGPPMVPGPGARGPGGSGRVAPSTGVAPGPGDLPRLPEPFDEPGAAAARLPADRLAAIAAGTAIHLLLELWDRKDVRWLKASAPRAARVAAAGAGAPEAAVSRRVEEILARAEESGRLDALRHQKAIARELPMLLEGENGDVWDGTIDLVAGDLVDGSPVAPVVIDFKTTEGGATADDLLGFYAGQLECYAEAVWRALRLEKRPEVRIEVL